MKYYVGKGTEFEKKSCKEYKTLDGALKAAAKDEELVVWDETGAIIGSLTDNVPEGALIEDDEAAGAGQDEPQTATEDENEDEAENDTSEDENSENGADNEPETIIPEGFTKATVVCTGALNIRRSCAWGNDNICGRAVAGQTYIVKAIHTVEGKKLIETIDGLFVSGASEHTKIETVV